MVGTVLLQNILNLRAIAGLVCLVLITKIIKGIFFSPIRNIPGPWHTTWTSSAVKLAGISGKRVYHIEALHQQYGPIVRISPTEISLNDLESWQTIYQTGSGFDKTDWYQKITQAARPGVFAILGAKQHAQRRKLMARPFSKSALRSRWETTVAEKTRLFIRGVLNDVEQLGQADLYTWWKFLATDVSSQIMFGESFDTLKLGKKNEYIKKMEVFMLGGGIALEFPVARLLGYLPVPLFKHMFSSNKYLLEYAQQAIQNAHQSKQTGNIFSSMLDEAEKDDGILEDADIQVEAGNLLFAGLDTTATGLTYLTWCVMLDPELRATLEREVETLPINFNDADIEKLLVFNATIEETLRLYTPTPSSLPRRVPDQGVVMHGHFIPGGFIVGTQTWSLHRNSKLWHEPERFNPYRFLISSTTEHDTADLKLVSLRSNVPGLGPFGTGSRTCLGIHLAYMQLRYGLAYFLRDCSSLKLSSLTTRASMKPVDYIMITPRDRRCLVMSS